MQLACAHRCCCRSQPLAHPHTRTTLFPRGHPFLGSVRPERESQTIFLSCVGAGVRNLSKKVQ